MTNKQIEYKDLPVGRQVEFKSVENILRGSLFIPSGKGAFPGVIFFHGNGGNGDKYFEAGRYLVNKGIMSLAFNYTGCGRSDGNYFTQTYKDAITDASFAYNFFLKQENLDKNRLGIVGGSFGGFVASMMLPEFVTKSLVLLSPSAHADPLSTKIDMGPLEEEVKYFQDRKNWENSKTYKNVEDYKGNLLVIKSENDENVPSEVVDKYFQTAKNVSKRKLITIKGADHRLSTEKMREEFYKIVTDWFLKTL
jgi:uncharacterized protein